MNAALYARVSSERQAEKELSIPAQLRELRRYVLEQNWTIAAEFVDEAKSGRTDDRPAFQEMIDRAQKGEFEAIVVLKLSRFARNREDSIVYKSLLRSRGIRVVSVQEPIDESPAGRFVEGILESVDQFYSESLGQDVKRGMAEAAGRGFFVGGAVPFGYRRVRIADGRAERTRLVPDPVEALTVTDLFTSYLRLRSVRALRKELRERGIRMPDGEEWYSQRLLYVLRNPVYAGIAKWRDVIRFGAYDAIIPRELFDQVQEVLRRNARLPARRVHSGYLLSGLLHCGLCGDLMHGYTRSVARTYYVCRRYHSEGKAVCAGGMIRTETVESFVLETLQKMLTPESVREGAALVLKVIEEERQRHEKRAIRRGGERARDARKRLARLYEAIELGTVDPRDLRERIEGLKAIIRSGALEIPDTFDFGPMPTVDEAARMIADVEDAFREATIEEKRELLQAGIDSVTYTRPDRLEIVYRPGFPWSSWDENGGPRLLKLELQRAEGRITRALGHKLVFYQEITPEQRSKTGRGKRCP
ncbi:MAG: hypothetical protein A2V88_00750 [Elusimicrobia bacterium RBG_16_66_12]|nr:MAG: hypothetical protein A2V88_00750 [Elusimicrobia bacterium RBG_16_66_12]